MTIRPGIYGDRSGRIDVREGSTNSSMLCGRFSNHEALLHVESYIRASRIQFSFITDRAVVIITLPHWLTWSVACGVGGRCNGCLESAYQKSEMCRLTGEGRIVIRPYGVSLIGCNTGIQPHNGMEVVGHHNELVKFDAWLLLSDLLPDVGQAIAELG